MKTFSPLLIVVLVAGLVGCQPKKPPQPVADGDAPSAEQTTEKAAPAATKPADSAEHVAEIKKLTDKVRRDGDGLVIEVDFRGTDIGDEAVMLLTDLPRLRSVLLSGTKHHGRSSQDARFDQDATESGSPRLQDHR